MSNCQTVYVNFDAMSTLNIINTTAFIEYFSFWNATCDICWTITSASYVILRASVFINNRDHSGLVLVNDDSTLTIERCAFRNNDVERFGGALQLSSGYTRIEETTFENNSASSGGAIFLDKGSSLSVAISNFTGNRALFGGAICAQNNVQLNIGDSYFISNFARKRSLPTVPQSLLKARTEKLSADGFLYRITGIPSIKSNAVGPEFPPNFQRNGGAISCTTHCNMNIRSSQFAKNHAETFGGSIVALVNSSVTVQDSEFDENNAGDSGGSIAVESHTTLVISGCNFTGNSVLYGSAGAIYARYHSNVELVGTIIHKNSAKMFGGAVMAVENISLKMAAVVFDSNSVNMIGGAIYVQDYCYVVFERCSLTRNAERLLYGSAIVTLSHSKLAINSAQ